jgi:hypothetical protein
VVDAASGGHGASDLNRPPKKITHTPTLPYVDRLSRPVSPPQQQACCDPTTDTPLKMLDDNKNMRAEIFGSPTPPVPECLRAENFPPGYGVVYPLVRIGKCNMFLCHCDQ